MNDVKPKRQRILKPIYGVQFIGGRFCVTLGTGGKLTVYEAQREACWLNNLPKAYSVRLVGDRYEVSSAVGGMTIHEANAEARRLNSERGVNGVRENCPACGGRGNRVSTTGGVMTCPKCDGIGRVTNSRKESA